MHWPPTRICMHACMHARPRGPHSTPLVGAWSRARHATATTGRSPPLALGPPQATSAWCPPATTRRARIAGRSRAHRAHPTPMAALTTPRALRTLVGELQKSGTVWGSPRVPKLGPAPELMPVLLSMRMVTILAYHSLVQGSQIVAARQRAIVAITTRNASATALPLQ